MCGVYSIVGRFSVTGDRRRVCLTVLFVLQIYCAYSMGKTCERRRPSLCTVCCIHHSLGLTPLPLLASLPESGNLSEKSPKKGWSRDCERKRKTSGSGLLKEEGKEGRPLSSFPSHNSPQITAYSSLLSPLSLSSLSLSLSLSLWESNSLERSSQLPFCSPSAETHFSAL